MPTEAIMACVSAFFAEVSLSKQRLKIIRGVALWDYLGARLNVPACQTIRPLPELILAKVRSP
jgi:hypothetical protein